MNIALTMSDRPGFRDELCPLLEETLVLLDVSVAAPDVSLLAAAPLLLLEIPLRGQDVPPALERFRRLAPDLAVVILAPDAYQSQVPEFFAAGAFEVLTGPPDRLRLHQVAVRALERSRLLRERAAWRPGRRPGGAAGPVPVSDGFAPDVFRRFSDLLCRAFDGERFYENVARTVADIFGLGRCALFIAHDGVYRIRGAFGWDRERVRRLALPAGEGLAARLVREAQIISRDRAGDPDRPAEAAALRGEMEAIGAAVCVPLLAHGRLPGFLALGGKISGDAFGGRDFELLSLLAVHLGLVMDNAALHRRVSLQNRERLMIIDNLPAGLIGVDRAGVISGFNRRAAAILGLEAAGLVGRGIEAAGSLVADYLRRALGRGELARGEQQLLPGTGRTVQLSTAVLRDEHDRVAGAVLIMADLTPVKELESRVDDLEKMNYWYQLAGSVAHQMRNPLTSIKTFVQLFPEKHHQVEFRDHFFRLVSADIARLDRIIGDMLEYARPVELETAEWLLADLCEAARRRFPAPAGVAPLTGEYCPGLRVRADRERLVRAIGCLLENAFEATGRAAAAPGPLVITAASEQGRRAWAEVLVRDRGPGLAAGARERLFSPFYTTKEKGMGMGLPIARRITEEHGGRIEIDDAPDGGVRARIMLPAVAGKPVEDEQDPDRR